MNVIFNKIEMQVRNACKQRNSVSFEQPTAWNKRRATSVVPSVTRDTRQSSRRRANQALPCSAASVLADKQKRRFARVSALSNNGKPSVTVQVAPQVSIKQKRRCSRAKKGKPNVTVQLREQARGQTKVQVCPIHPTFCKIKWRILINCSTYIELCQKVVG